MSTIFYKEFIAANCPDEYEKGPDGRYIRNKKTEAYKRLENRIKEIASAISISDSLPISLSNFKVVKLQYYKKPQQNTRTGLDYGIENLQPVYFQAIKDGVSLDVLIKLDETKLTIEKLQGYLENFSKDYCSKYVNRFSSFEQLHRQKYEDSNLNRIRLGGHTNFNLKFSGAFAKGWYYVWRALNNSFSSKYPQYAESANYPYYLKVSKTSGKYSENGIFEFSFSEIR